MFSGPSKLGEGCWGLHWTGGAREVTPNPAVKPLTGAPAARPGSMFCAFFMSNALAGPLPSPHSLVRAKPGPCQAQWRPLAKNSRAVLRKARGLSHKPEGTQVSTSCPSLEKRGRMTSQQPRAVKQRG